MRLPVSARSLLIFVFLLVLLSPVWSSTGCNSTADCPSYYGSCENNLCRLKAGSCEYSTDCRWFTETCTDHQCVPILNCTSDADCTPSRYGCDPDRHQCVLKAGYCEGGADCSLLTEYCNETSHQCTLYAGFCYQDSNCEPWQQCRGVCVARPGFCMSLSDCGYGVASLRSCNTASHTCQLAPGRCLNDSNCPSAQQCEGSYCVRRPYPFCDETGGCNAFAEVCNLSAHTCRLAGKPCGDNSVCPPDEKCSASQICVAKDGWCDRDDDCMVWQSCDLGSRRCLLKSGVCNRDSDCASGFCQDGRCAASPSTSPRSTSSSVLSRLNGRIYFDDIQFDRFSEPGKVHFLLVRRALPDATYRLRYGNFEYQGYTDSDGYYDVTFNPPLPISPGQFANLSIKLLERGNSFYVGYGTFRHTFGASRYYGGNPVQFWSAFELSADANQSMPRNFGSFNPSDETDFNLYEGYANTLNALNKFIYRTNETLPSYYHSDSRDLPYVQFARIYANTYEAFRYASDRLNQPLGQKPRAVLITPEVRVTAYYVCEFGVAIPNSTAGLLQPDAPVNREWHEYGHGVMCDGFSQFPQRGLNDTNHGGLSNPTSTDSFIEGWATAFGALVAKNTGSPRPDLYPAQDALVPLEFNYPVRPASDPSYRLWFNEDISVASLLWDLTDAKSDLDHDRVQIDAGELWAFLKQDSFTFSDGRRGSIRTVADLYEALNSTYRWGLNNDDDGDGTDNLEELFISRGIFQDVAGDGVYRSGEAVGTTLWGGQVRRQLTLPNQTVLTIQSSAGWPVVVAISISLEPPYENYSYHYQTLIQGGEDRIHLLLPPPAYPSSAEVRVSRPDYRTESRPYKVDSSTYYQKLASGEGLGTYKAILIYNGWDQLPPNCPPGYGVDSEFNDCVPLPPLVRLFYEAAPLAVLFCLGAPLAIGSFLLVQRWRRPKRAAPRPLSESKSKQ